MNLQERKEKEKKRELRSSSTYSGAAYFVFVMQNDWRMQGRRPCLYLDD